MLPTCHVYFGEWCVISYMLDLVVKWMGAVVAAHTTAADSED